ncbi:hypothetical protein J2T15_004029 [Paenibacillus harenae]|uniref:Uncharacterized protein n=1 Tax=Paenibacillus harenae TaxID=306543 RepID=A0ABT9U4S9_PAEHA|nr:hypothetical protein [Paenibacillus harenae]
MRIWVAGETEPLEVRVNALPVPVCPIAQPGKLLYQWVPSISLLSVPESAVPPRYGDSTINWATAPS